LCAANRLIEDDPAMLTGADKGAYEKGGGAPTPPAAVDGPPGKS
jgi:hypothetical protein